MMHQASRARDYASGGNHFEGKTPVFIINLDLNESDLQWMTQLRSNWNYVKNSPIVVNTIVRRFEISTDPYADVIKLMYNCPDFKLAKQKSLTFLLIDEFKKWCSKVRNNIIHMLTREKKITAFNVVRQQGNYTLMKMVAEVFEMMVDCDIFLEIIQTMIQLKQYKEACQSATLLGLHTKFGIDEFLVPLILQDKTVVVEDFLNDSAYHQTDLVGFLDIQLGKNASIKMSLESYILKHKIPDIKWDKLQNKPYRKLVTRYKKLYGLPDDVTPNLIKKQNEGALQFLVHRRYIENAIGDESFKEMVHEAVQNDPYLQLELCVLVSQHGDLQGALHFAHLYHIPKHDWPYTVRMHYENPDGERLQQRVVEEWWSDSPQTVEYYKLTLPIGHIFLIDCQSEFHNFLENYLKHANVVGIDCEWKPSFGTQKNELALMQIATRTEVFILDVIQLGSKTKAGPLWEKLGNYCFNNCDILKLGFGLTSDMSMIRQSLPHTNINQKGGFLDLLNVWRQVEKHNIKLPYEGQSAGPSLSGLVQQCFGLPLNKADQFSNWEKRPLRNSQLEYAALDAYCLIEIYDVLKLCCEKRNCNFDEVCYTLMSSSSTSMKRHRRHTHKKRPMRVVIEQPPNTHFTPVDASSIQFVCDTMLQGLGKSLRKCGINTKILENNDSHMTCLKIYQDEMRYILTRGQTYSKFAGSVPPGHCFNVVNDDLEDQLKSVLDYYKITVRMEHVFSICQACNNNNFIKLSQSTMQTLLAARTKSCVPAGYYEDDGEEATGFTSEEDFDEDHLQRRSENPGISRKWELCSDEKVDVGLCQTRLGVKIQVEAVPEGVLQKQQMYYVCESCGKVYWDGTHFERALAGKLQSVVI